MNEHLFLKQLRIQLRGLPSSEIEEIINDYQSYFSEARESGLSEQEATNQLGNPLDIARDIKVSTDSVSTKGTSNTTQIRSVIVMIGLAFLNFTVLLGPVLGIIGAFFGVIVSCVVFIASPFLVVGSMLFNDGQLFELFFSFALSGVGLLLFPLLTKLGRRGIELLKKYVEWNKRVIRGEVL